MKLERYKVCNCKSSKIITTEVDGIKLDMAILVAKLPGAVSQNVSDTNLIKTEHEDMETMVVYYLHGKPIRFEIVLMQGRRKLFSIQEGGG